MMRSVPAAVGFAVLVGSLATARAGETVLVPEGDASWRYHVLELPFAPIDDPLTRAAVLGAATVSSVASTVAGNGRSPDWTLPQTADGPEQGWRSGGIAPFGSSPAAKCGLCATRLEAAPLTRVAALRVRRGFDVDPAVLPKMRALTLRARYQDGLVVYLNGVLIAQRLLAPTGSIDAGAIAQHGTEWETFSVPVLPWLMRAEGNLLAVEVRPFDGRALLFDLALSASDAARLMAGPFLTEVTPERANLFVESDLPTIAELRWGATDAYGKSLRSGDAAPLRHHQLRMDGLAAGENHYRVLLYPAGATPATAPIIDTGDTSFATPPGPDDPVRFVVYGDVRQGHAVHTQLLQGILGHGVDFVSMTGDMVARGHDEGDWQKFFEVIRDLARGTPVYPAVGNHEIGTAGTWVMRFRQLFPRAQEAEDPLAAYYSYDVGGIHIVNLDSNRYLSPQQLAWVDKDLTAARKRGVRAIFAVTHHGPVSRAIHGGSREALTQYVPILQKHKVAAVFSGHDHTYERGFIGKSKLQYVVSGGGGAATYKSKCGRPGTRACKDTALAFASEHHYVLVEVSRDFYKMCPYRPDATMIEACVTTELPGAKAGAKSSPTAGRAPR